MHGYEPRRIGDKHVRQCDDLSKENSTDRQSRAWETNSIPGHCGWGPVYSRSWFRSSGQVDQVRRIVNRAERSPSRRRSENRKSPGIRQGSVHLSCQQCWRQLRGECDHRSWTWVVYRTGWLFVGNHIKNRVKHLSQRPLYGQSVSKTNQLFTRVLVLSFERKVLTEADIISAFDATIVRPHMTEYVRNVYCSVY